jgi:hypothetical protein
MEQVFRATNGRRFRPDLHLVDAVGDQGAGVIFLW